jgi:hypothetical protein
MKMHMEIAINGMERNGVLWALIASERNTTSTEG